jgi:integrase/recombinase XerD
MTSRSLIPQHNAVAKAFQIVNYLTSEDIKRMLNTISGRKADRDKLLIVTLYQTGLRISEALQVEPRLIEIHNGHAVLRIIGKGKKPRLVACPDSLANRLKAFAFDNGLGLDEKIFNLSRNRAWQIIKQAAQDADINKKVYPHLLRHSDAIERLRQTGNPKALQLHLGHSSMVMTMRYLSTLTSEDAVKVQQEVEFDF